MQPAALAGPVQRLATMNKTVPGMAGLSTGLKITCTRNMRAYYIIHIGVEKLRLCVIMSLCHYVAHDTVTNDISNSNGSGWFSYRYYFNMFTCSLYSTYHSSSSISTISSTKSMMRVLERTSGRCFQEYHVCCGVACVWRKAARALSTEH